MSGPKRFESDANFRIDPAVLAKTSESGFPPPELAEAMRAAQDGPPLAPEDRPGPCSLCGGGEPLPSEDEDTQESCPRCGIGMVRPETARAYRRDHPTENYVDEGIEVVFDLTNDPEEEETP